MSDAAGGYREYHEYLLTRSTLSRIYRLHYLYPRLRRHLHGRVLDVGCGIGDFLGYYRNALGLDVNPINVEYCRAHGCDASLITEQRFPVETGYFDSAVVDNVVEHLEEPGPLLSETHRALKPGGALIVGVPGRKGYAADPDHKRFYSAEKLAAVVCDAGFVHERDVFTPFRSDWFDLHLNLYCLYGIFTRSKRPGD